MSASHVLAAAGGERRAVIDQQHLDRMTLGDRRLEREVLEIFVRQSAILLDRMAHAEPALASAAAHTLLGSARGIGAWRVARAAEAVERAASGEARAEATEEAITELRAAALEASAAIGIRLSSPPDIPAPDK